eukprot:UN17789
MHLIFQNIKKAQKTSIIFFCKFEKTQKTWLSCLQATKAKKT